MKKSIEQVQSWYYYIHRDSDLATAMQDIRSSSVDMVVLTLVDPQPLSLHYLGPDDPVHDKLILGYFLTVEAGAADYLMRQEFANGPPSWLGAPHPPWPDLYSVRFWEPAWQTVLHRYIDAQIAAGVDGIFLDGGPFGWMPNNTLGNPPHADVLGDLYRLLVHVREYVDQKQLDRPFYLIALGVHDVAAAHPGLYDVLDGMVVESLGWVFAPDNPFASVPHPVPLDDVLASVDSVYGGRTTVFTVDYPPLQGLDDMFDVFRQAADLGWRPSISHDAHQDGAALRDSPRQAVAVADNSSVIGDAALVNMLSAGRHSGVSLTGGVRGDYLLAGANATTLHGGAGNDRLFMHPDARYSNGQIELRLSSTVTAGSVPHVVVRVNGEVVLADTGITAARGEASQSFLLPIPGGSLHSVTLEVSGCTFLDATRFSNLSIDGFFISGQPVSLEQATFQNGAVFANTASRSGYSNDGSVTFGATMLSQFSVLLGSTETTADGGSGIDVAVYESQSSNFQWQPVAGGWTVRASGLELADQFQGVERLRFDDVGIALDVDANAGIVAKILGAVFGPAAVANKAYVGVGLGLLDAGMSYDSLMQLALVVRMPAASNAELVSVLYSNVFGDAPNTSERDLFTGMLDRGEVTRNGLGMLAAESALNAGNINLVGLAERGLEYD